MSAANRRAALGALDRVRPLVSGLTRDRTNDELAADLGRAWEATEVVLRALLGGSTVGGQSLVREVRQRELLTLEQAHALVNFHAARDRAELPGYQVAAGDVAAAREAVDELDRALGATPDVAGAEPRTRPVTAEARTAPVVQPVDVGDAAPRGRSVPALAIVAIAALLLVVLPLGAWWFWSNRAGGDRSLAAATRLYASGDHERARMAFVEIAREAPTLALPHIYLGRIAREQNDVTVAQQELQTAIRLDPNSAVAQREMGSLMLATNNPELARRFYRRAVELDPSDRVATGYLGCALLRVGQVDLGRRFIDRAGPGDWSACTASAPPMPDGTTARRLSGHALRVALCALRNGFAADPHGSGADRSSRAGRRRRRGSPGSRGRGNREPRITRNDTDRSRRRSGLRAPDREPIGRAPRELSGRAPAVRRTCTRSLVLRPARRAGPIGGPSALVRGAPSGAGSDPPFHPRQSAAKLFRSAQCAKRKQSAAPFSPRSSGPDHAPSSVMRPVPRVAAHPHAPEIHHMTATFANPSLAFDPETVQRHRLDNGLTVLVRRDASSPVAAVVTYVKAGYFDETDDVVGIAHVLEHMFFKGTPTRGVGEIARETKASGGYLNAHTIYDHTSYYAVLPSSGFAAGLEVQADAYANSVIDADELRRELEVIIQEARRKRDNPHAVTTESLYALLHDRHRMRRWRIGEEEQLRALTRDAMLRFYRNFYRPGNTILSIVGDVDVDRTLEHGGAPVRRAARAARWNARRGRRSPTTPNSATANGRATSSARSSPPAGARRGCCIPTRRCSTSPPWCSVAAARRGSTAPSANASSPPASPPTTTRLMTSACSSISAETAPETALEAARATWAQLRSLLQEGVGEHELARARHLYESRWLRRLESMEGQASYLAEWEAAGDWRLGERYLSRIAAAHQDGVTEAARKYLVPDRAGLVVYRPEGTPELAGNADAARALLRPAEAFPLPPTPPRRAAPAARPDAAPQLECSEGGVHVYRTPEGLPILVWPKPGAPVSYAGVYLAGGSSAEDAERAGLTKLLTRVALKGTERRTATQIAEDAEMVGAALGGSAGTDSFGWSVSVPAPHLPAALDLLADVSQRATVPSDAFETERAVALSELAALRDDMYRWPVRLLLESAYQGHPYGVPTSGDDASLAAITAAEVREWQRRRVLEGCAVVGIVADGEPDTLAALAARHFTMLGRREWTPPQPPAWPTGLVQRVETREKAQTALALGFPAPSRRNDDRFAAELLSGVASGLGGRFFEELRDRRSLAYTVHASASERLLGGIFIAYIATAPEREAEAREGLLREFARLREMPVTEEELQRAKTYALGTHAISRESGGSRLGEMIDAWLLGTGLGELAAYETRVAALTAADLQSVAGRYFDPDRRVEGVVRAAGR